MCVCVCVCVMNMFIYMYICICIYICAYARTMCQKWLDNQHISYRSRMPRFHYQLKLCILD